MNENDKRSPEEIESDIERTRADFTSTIEAIQHKLSPSEMMGNAKEYALSTTPGAFSVNLINTIRDNPIPVALISIGVAWLMRADKRPRYDTGYVRGRQSAYYADMDSAYEDEFATGYGAGTVGTGSREGVMQRAKSRTSDAARGIRDKAGEVGQRLSGTASSVSSRLSTTASTMGDRLSTTASTMGDRLSTTASTMSDRMSESAQSARERMQSTAQTAQERMSEMTRRSQEQYYRARQRAGELIEEQPLVLAALGVAVGAALGATLPRTQRENELMGTVRDDLLDRAKETAREQAETLKQSAQRVAETAKQEASRVQEQVAGAASQGSGSRGTESTQFGGTSGQPSIH